MVVGKVAVHLCLTLIIKKIKICVKQDRMVTTLNIIFSVVQRCPYYVHLHCPKSLAWVPYTFNTPTRGNFHNTF